MLLFSTPASDSEIGARSRRVPSAVEHAPSHGSKEYRLQQLPIKRILKRRGLCSGRSTAAFISTHMSKARRIDDERRITVRSIIDEIFTMCRLPLRDDGPEDAVLFIDRNKDDDDVAARRAAGDDAPRTPHHAARVALSTLAFWFFVSLIPLYNKHYFQKQYFPYPIATAGIQTGMVGASLVVVNVLMHFCRRGREDDADISDDDSGHFSIRQPSWVFGPHLLWKLKVCLPVGCLFGLKYGVTNLGLKMVPTPIHLLLQSTDLLWTVLWASLINRERVSKFGLACLTGCILGTVILSIHVMKNVEEAPALAILFNLISPVLLGLVISTLRSACVELKRPDNPVGGTMSSIEITALKLVICSAVALSLADAFEDDWRAAFQSLPASTRRGVLGSSIPILFYQVNCTYLTSLTSAVTVGLVGQLKVIPQWLAALAFAPGEHIAFGSWNTAGSIVTLISTAAYALHNWYEYAEVSKRGDGQDADVESGIESGGIEDILTDESSGLLENATPETSTPSSSSYRSISII